jgi:Cof subfamily protein (haloacid dehalogenase superfamily)
VAVRALAIDLDGTLLDRSDEVSPRNRAALADARRRGLHVIIASARWYQIARQVAGQLSVDGPPIEGPVIACSGAQVRRLRDDADLFDERIPPAFATAFAEIVDRQRCIAWAALADEVVMKLEGSSGTTLAGLRQVPQLGDAVSDAAPRMLLLQGTRACELVEAELEPAWGTRVRFTDSVSGHGKRILTLTAANADKGAALLAACADLGVDPSEVVAFGDARNDLPMFSVAGASVSMGQAADGVKAAASYVSGDAADDGVAMAVERLLEQGEAMFTPR